MHHNIIVILCDQLRADFLKCYGCHAVPTPNLDRLARDGVIFDRAITASTVCAPARASMMTGCYPSDHQVWTNDMPFRAGLDFLPHRMNAAGYVTAAFGKLHHFPALDGKGFQVFHPMEEGRLADAEPYLQWLRQRRPGVDGVWNMTDGAFDFTEEQYYEHWIADQAIEFLEDHKRDGPNRPFMAWVSFQGPHGPNDPPPEVKGLCNDEELPSPLPRALHDHAALPEVIRNRIVREPMPEGARLETFRLEYAEMIAAIDRQIGRILHWLDGEGLYDHTSIIFSADHGDMLGDYGICGKGPFPYRAQLEVPLIVANHPMIEGGSRSDALASNLDIGATCLAIAGDKEPFGYSRSLLNLAQSRPDKPREVNYSEFCDSIKTVEDHRYRFSYYPFTSACQLFDKENDPDETTNLADREEYAEVCRRFLAHVIDFMILSKGLRVEAHDFVADQQAGVAAKDPRYRERFPIAFPLNADERTWIQQAGMPSDINEFCRGKKVRRCYSAPYWMSADESKNEVEYYCLLAKDDPS